MLETVFHNSLHFDSRLIIKQRVKGFIDKL